MTMTSVAPHLAAQQQQQIDPTVAQHLIQRQLAQQQALMAQQQQFPQQQYAQPQYGPLQQFPQQQYGPVQQFPQQQYGGQQQYPQQQYGQQQYGQQQFAPYGLIGDLAGAVLPQVGSWLGQQFGSPQLGQQVGGYAGQLAQRFSPWEAGPSIGLPQQQQYPQQQYGQQQYPEQQYGQQQYPQQQYGQQQYPQQQYPQQPYGGQQQYPQQQYAQQQHAHQQQIAPYGQLGGPAGPFLGGIGGGILPLGVDPMQLAAHAQAQQAARQQIHGLPYGSSYLSQAGQLPPQFAGPNR